jgi:hypothetical protein
MKFGRYLFILCFVCHSLSSSFQSSYGNGDTPNDNASGHFNSVDATFYVQLVTLGVIFFYAVIRAGNSYCQYFHSTCSDENGLRTGAAIRNFCCVGCCWCLPIRWIQNWTYDMDDEKTIRTLDDINRRYPPKQSEVNDIEAPPLPPILPSLPSLPPLQKSSSANSEKEIIDNS